MKIRVTFKTPDAVDYAVTNTLENSDGIDDIREKSEEVFDILSKWVKYRECVTIEFDIDTQTAKVVEIN